MITVVGRPEQARFVTCRHCHCVLGYEFSDVQVGTESSEGSYFYNMRQYKFIECPNCKRKVKV